MKTKDPVTNQADRQIAGAIEVEKPTKKATPHQLIKSKMKKHVPEPRDETHNKKTNIKKHMARKNEKKRIRIRVKHNQQS